MVQLTEDEKKEIQEAEKAAYMKEMLKKAEARGYAEANRKPPGVAFISTMARGIRAIVNGIINIFRYFLDDKR